MESAPQREELTSMGGSNPDKNSPVFSVIIPTYNRAHVIKRTIYSVLSQTFYNFELVVVDDGSTDNTGEIVRKIEDPRLRYIYQDNRGRSAARNVGVAQSRGQYVTFLDSDDEVFPEWLEHFVNSYENECVGIICTGVLIIEEGDQEKKLVQLPKDLGPHYYHQLGRFVPPGTFALRRDLFDAVGGYNESLSHSENTDLALRLVSYCTQEGWQILSIPEPLVIYHQQPLRWAKDAEKFQLRLESVEYMMQSHGERYLQNSPKGYTNYCAIAGVNAARLGRYKEARRYFLLAIRVYPWNWRHYSRLLLALIPPLGRKFWLRYQ